MGLLGALGSYRCRRRLEGKLTWHRNQTEPKVGPQKRASLARATFRVSSRGPWVTGRLPDTTSDLGRDEGGLAVQRPGGRRPGQCAPADLRGTRGRAVCRKHP